MSYQPGTNLAIFAPPSLSVFLRPFFVTQKSRGPPVLDVLQAAELGATSEEGEIREAFNRA